MVPAEKVADGSRLVDARRTSDDPSPVAPVGGRQRRREIALSMTCSTNLHGAPLRELGTWPSVGDSLVSDPDPLDVPAARLSALAPVTRGDLQPWQWQFPRNSL